ncbi:ubiquitin-specific protease DOA4 KNAG_0D01930 [Huiozyma naganishii CBS 8797]|uniref:Ubiquitin carboxyl-terminal hydrolase n=1 Tax=Huiozyma naganishii (strain ATCC MYA-139 / BCRC 22969 / CBS 8797 / KCTC 17520 / NBRC 10181 / NCYC 3082 / Yp74L-3) TaxID=1071383 RepID=J7S5P3_HUIN7|nr:hypothetical protein KNAG_0D01930 [Kazachstania naganishii CBS 8797]CCK69944.1 hypothetical protein KNAG_0D01930 [Kazachstania naganishii CBS 8797]
MVSLSDASASGGDSTSQRQYCSSLARLSEIAGKFILENEERSPQDSQNLKLVLQQCIDTLSNYKDQGKRLKNLHLNGQRADAQVFELYESAYIYYKIMHLLVLSRIPNFIQFQTLKAKNGLSKNEKELLDIYNTLVKTLLHDENITPIKMFIKAHSRPDTSVQRDKGTPLPATGSPIFLDQLDEILRDHDSSQVLFIDVRTRLDFNKGHFKVPNIICIEPVSFKSSYSDHDLEKKSMITSTNDEIVLFHRRQEFAFIVLYSNDTDKKSGIVYKERKTLLANLLLNHSFEKPLSNRLYVLENGFDSWTKQGRELVRLDADPVANGKLEQNGTTEDSAIYTNGNTSRLSLQHLPKMSPSIGVKMDQSMKDMMSSTAPAAINTPHLLRQQSPNDLNNGSTLLRRTASLKKIFPSFMNSSPSSNSREGSARPSSPKLYIEPTQNSQLYSNSTPVTSSLPKMGIHRTSSRSNYTQYPETPLLQNDRASSLSPGDMSITPINTRCKPSFTKSSSPQTYEITNGKSGTTSTPLSNTIQSSSPSQATGSSQVQYPQISHPIDEKLNPLMGSKVPNSPQLPPLPSKSVSTNKIVTASSKSHLPNNSILTSTGNHVAESTGPQFDLDFMVGLENMGNSCYLNCIIQCLLGNNELIKIFLDNSFEKYVNLNSKLGSKGVLARYFSRLIHTMYNNARTIKHGGKHAPVKPAQFKMACGSVNSAFKGGSQQDCQEFCQFLLDGLHEDLNQCGGNKRLAELTEEAENLREKLSLRIASSIEWERFLTTDFSVIGDLFQGQYASRLQCKTCGKTSTTYQPFSVLSIPVPSKHISKCSIIDCFDEFTKVENLEVDEQWSCPRCKSKQPSTKKLTITRLPRNLIIHLKRFDNRLNKNNILVQYPFTLDLTTFWANDFDGKLPLNVSELPTRGQKPPFNYKLYGVACHFGSLYGGHYTAYVDKGIKNGWYYFDDTSCRPIKNSMEPITSSAYVLFYKRIYGASY